MRNRILDALNAVPEFDLEADDVFGTEQNSEYVTEADVADAAAATANLSAAMSALSSTKQILEDSLTTGGVYAETAPAIGLVLQVAEQAGIPPVAITAPAMESFGVTDTRVNATNIALESIGETIKSGAKALFEKIIAMLKKLKAWLIGFVRSKASKDAGEKLAQALENNTQKDKEIQFLLNSINQHIVEGAKLKGELAAQKHYVQVLTSDIAQLEKLLHDKPKPGLQKELDAFEDLTKTFKDLVADSKPVDNLADITKQATAVVSAFDKELDVLKNNKDVYVTLLCHPDHDGPYEAIEALKMQLGVYSGASIIEAVKDLKKAIEAGETSGSDYQDAITVITEECDILKAYKVKTVKIQRDTKAVRDLSAFLQAGGFGMKETNYLVKLNDVVTDLFITVASVPNNTFTSELAGKLNWLVAEQTKFTNVAYFIRGVSATEPSVKKTEATSLESDVAFDSENGFDMESIGEAIKSGAKKIWENILRLLNDLLDFFKKQSPIQEKKLKAIRENLKPGKVQTIRTPVANDDLLSAFYFPMKLMEHLETDLNNFIHACSKITGSEKDREVMLKEIETVSAKIVEDVDRCVYTNCKQNIDKANPKIEPDWYKVKEIEVPASEAAKIESYIKVVETKTIAVHKRLDKLRMIAKEWTNSTATSPDSNEVGIHVIKLISLVRLILKMSNPTSIVMRVKGSETSMESDIDLDNVDMEGNSVTDFGKDVKDNFLKGGVLRKLFKIVWIINAIPLYLAWVFLDRSLDRRAVKQLVENNKNIQVSEAAESDAITELEKESGVRFGQQYRGMLQKFGCLKLDGKVVHGIANGKDLDVLGFDAKARGVMATISPDVLVVSVIGDNYIGVNSKDDVFAFNTNGKKSLESKFIPWVVSLMKNSSGVSLESEDNEDGVDEVITQAMEIYTEIGTLQQQQEASLESAFPNPYAQFIPERIEELQGKFTQLCK